MEERTFWVFAQKHLSISPKYSAAGRIFKRNVHVYGNGKSHVSRAVIHAISPGEAVLTAKYNGEIADTIKIRVYPAD